MVITLVDFVPSPRTDPWLAARVEGSSDHVTWSELATIALDPVDPDPLEPLTRAFTVHTDATEPVWVRVVFVDALGDEEASDPLRYPGTPPYFTVEEFRTKHPGLSEAEYSDAAIDEMRVIAEAAYEDVIGFALVPRTSSELLRDAHAPSGDRRLQHAAVGRIVAAVDQKGQTVDVAGVVIDGLWAHRPGGWPRGPVTITVEHGWDEPPPRDRQAVMTLTRVWLTDGPVDARAVQQVVVESGQVVNLATPDRLGSFGIPEVDAAAGRRARHGWGL